MACGGGGGGKEGFEARSGRVQGGMSRKAVEFCPAYFERDSKLSDCPVTVSMTSGQTNN